MKYVSKITGTSHQVFGKDKDMKENKLAVGLRMPIRIHEKVEQYHVNANTSMSQVMLAGIDTMLDILNSGDVELIQKIKTLSPQINVLELKKATKQAEEAIIKEKFSVGLKRLEKLIKTAWQNPSGGTPPWQNVKKKLITLIVCVN